jgi:hypothetical protein
LHSAVYVAQAPSLTWKKGEHSIAFWPHKIAIGHLEDRAQAQKVAQGLADLANRTWARRAEIEPYYEVPLYVDCNGHFWLTLPESWRSTGNLEIDDQKTGQN